MKKFILIFIFVLLNLMGGVRDYPYLEEWLETHSYEDFKGPIYVRMKPLTNESYIVETLWIHPNPAVGSVPHKIGFITNKGLVTESIKREETSILSLKGKTNTIWLKIDPGPGGSDYLRAIFSAVKIDSNGKVINEPLKHVNVEVEVSSEESEKGIFYKTKEVTDARGFIHIRIPPKGWVDKEKEKSMKHVLSFQDIIRYDLELLKKEFKTIPTLKKIFISVWVHYELANLPKDIEKNFWELLRYLGINGIDRWDLGTVNFKEFFSEYNILSTTDILWPYVKLDWNEAETIEETIERIMDDYFKRLYEGRKKRLEEGETYMEYLVPHVYGNCTDEPGAATNAKRINETPKILNDFREYLKKNKLTPEFFGKKDWEEVFALDDRKQLKSEDIFDLHKNRLFYWTHKYIQHYTCLFWKGVTKAIHKYFKVEGVSPNFQAGPCRGGFLGNDNCVGVLGCTIDFHKLYRENVFTGMKLEDWTYGWDFGIGKIDFGMAVVRSATRNKNIPRKFLLVGGEYIPGKAFAALMNNVKGIQLYLYGPIGQIGPIWCNVDYAVREAADLTRLIANLEEEVYNAKNPETKIALLVSCTSDAMGALGYYFLSERQAVYTALRHSYFSVDLISEYDILEDNILKNYKILYLVEPNVSRSAFLKIKDWVKEGGYLVGQIGSGFYDEYNQRSNLIDLEEIYGVSGLDIDFLDKKEIDRSKTIKDKITIKENFFKAENKINVYGAKIKIGSITTGEVVGTYEDGAPAVIINRFGKGKALLCGTNLGQTYFNYQYVYNLNEGKSPNHMRFDYPRETRRLITEMIYDAGLKNDWEFSIPGLYSNLMDIPNGKLLYVIDGWVMRPIPEEYLKIVKNVECSLNINKEIKKVVSSRFGELKFKKEGEKIKFNLDVSKPDIVAIYFK